MAAELTGAAPRLDGVGEDTGKARTRREGSAVALDDSDRLLLNLLQGRFPLAERPFAAIAEAAGTTEAEAIERTRRLLNERIIRQLTPIYDTRALGYASMLRAATSSRGSLPVSGSTSRRRPWPPAP